MAKRGMPDQSDQAAPASPGVETSLTSLSLWGWVLAGLGFLLGHVILTAPPKPPRVLQGFDQTARFDVWGWLIAGQVALWAIVSPLLWAMLVDLWKRTRRPPNRWKLLAAYGLLSAFILVMLSGKGPYAAPSPLAHYSARIDLLNALALAAALPGVLGIWSMRPFVDGVRSTVTVPHAHGPEPNSAAQGEGSGEADGGRWSARCAGAVADLLYARGVLQRLVGALGAMIGASALAAGALRNAVLAWHSPESQQIKLPLEFVVLFGILFAVLLALVYLPIYTSIQQQGRRLVETCFPIPLSHVPTAEWYANRQRLEGFLCLGIQPGESLRAGIAILAPLSGILVTTLLPGAS